MRIGNLHVYRADATPTAPLCVSGDSGELSLTIWTNSDGSVKGVLAHRYKNDEIVDVTGAGDIPAEYVAYEENATIR